MPRSLFRPLTHLSSFSVLFAAIVPTAIWIALSFGLMSMFDENEPEETGAAAILLVLMGAVFVALLSGFIGGILAHREVIEDDEISEPDESPYDLGDFVPDRYLDVWKRLTKEFGDENFALWVIDRAEPGVGDEEVKRLAHQLRDTWFDQSCRSEVAGHEAAHAIVGMALNRTPRHSAIWAEGDDFEGETTFYSPRPAIDPAENLWQDLRISLAGIAANSDGGASARGSEVDCAQANDIALELIARGRKPEGFAAEAVVENYLREARVQAAAILDQHHSALSALTQAIDERFVLGGHELRSIFAEHLPDSDPTTAGATSA